MDGDDYQLDDIDDDNDMIPDLLTDANGDNVNDTVLMKNQDLHTVLRALGFS